MNSPLSDSDDSAFLFTSEIKKPKTNGCSSKTFPMKLKKDNDLINESINFIFNQNKQNCENENSATENKLNELNENFSRQKQEKSNDETDGPKINFALTLDEKLENIEHKNIAMKEIKLCNTKNFMCPLCLKTFDLESAQVSHMKQCAKKKKMTTKQLLETLENHKKQLQNKIISGTMLKAYSSSKSKRDTDLVYEDSNSMYHLALGLTLSKSMTDNVNFNINSEQAGRIETNKVTLKKFGFTSSLSNSKNNERRKLKGSKLCHYSLKERTKEERERLITEKAAVILLTENDEFEVPKCDNHSVTKESDYLSMSKSEETYLWKIGENENNSNWYVEELKEILFDIKKSKEIKDRLSETSEVDNIKDLLVKLNLPRSSISSDWKKLINNKQWSDLIFVTKDLKTIYMHSIVLYARCPKALSLDLMTKFSQFDCDTVFLFLQYLYCGVLDGLNPPTIQKLFNLAQALEYEELILVLNVLKKNMLTKCNKEDCNNIVPDSTLNFLWNKETSQIIQNSSQIVKRDTTMAAERKIIVNSEETGWINNEDEEDTVKKKADSNTNDLCEVTIQCESKKLAHEGFKQAIFEDEIKVMQSNVFEKQEESMEEENNSELSKSKAFEKNQYCSQEKHAEKFYSNDQDCPISEEISQMQEKKNIISDLDIYNQENDMFEDAEYLHEQHHQQFHIESSFSTNISPIEFLENKDEGRNMIVSTPSDLSKEVIDGDSVVKLPKTNQASLDMEYEIPFFDPYEHFNTDLTDLHLSEPVVLSQSLISKDMSTSTAKEVDSKKYFCRINENSRESEAKSIPDSYPCVTPDRCSTPTTEFPLSKPSYEVSDSEKSIEKSTNRRKLREKKIHKNSSRLSMKYKFRGRTRKNTYEMKNWKKLDRESKKSEEVLTKSMLNEFNNSFRSASSKTPPSGSCKNFIEVTPHILPGEEFIENISPVPDYSIMGTSTIKKHLSKYGLKKSLSKKNAKKILRHIYEELHPVLNVKSGKIVKYLSEENVKKNEKRGNIKRKKVTTVKDSEKILEDERGLDIDTKIMEKNIDDFDSETDDSLHSPKKVVSQTEDDSGSYSSLNVNRSTDNESGLEKQLTQTQKTTFSDAKDAYTAIYDLIQSNPELRQRILTYEPIWLEEFQKKLHEKYKKKIKLSVLMDYLDMQCITFRYKNNKKQNLKIRRKSKKQL